MVFMSYGFLDRVHVLPWDYIGYVLFGMFVFEREATTSLVFVSV